MDNKYFVKDVLGDRLKKPLKPIVHLFKEYIKGRS